MDVYDDNIIIFGGAGEYIKKLKSRETFSDLWLYNLNTLKWKGYVNYSGHKNEYLPIGRMHHASCVLNSYLLGKRV